MHRVFYIQEFVEKIMDELDVSGGQKDLARLARTCRLFTDPALNRLWASPDDGAWHLTQCMSQNLWKIERSYIGGLWYEKMVLACGLSDAIRRGPGDRFCYYAKRMQSLDISGIDTSARGALYDHIARLTVDPRLVHLWTSTNEIRFPLLYGLTFSDRFSSRQYPHIASTIRTLLRLSPIKFLAIFIYRDAVDQVQAELRHEILDACRGLGWLCIGDIQAGFDKSGASTKWSNFVGDMISHATQLRKCMIALPMNVLDLHHMSALENLTSFTIREVTPALRRPFVLPVGSFARLESLQVHEHNTSASVTRSMLSFPPNGCLKKVAVIYYQPIDMDHIHRRSARTGVLGSNGFGGFETVSNHGGAVGISLLSVPSSGARFVNV